MIYRFDAYELDTRLAELRRDGEAAPVEPQVFALLVHLIENRDRLVTKDELLEVIWHGRVVSDAAIDSRVRSARQAIGDDGQAQRRLKTARGLGFRFLGEVTSEPSRDDLPPPAPPSAPAAVVAPATPIPVETAAPAAADSGGPQAGPPAGLDTGAPAADAAIEGRPSIAVLPFQRIGEADGIGAAIAQALPHDLIAALSRLRWLFVIARASSFQFQGTDATEAGRRLGVRYCLAGTVEHFGPRIEVAAELIDTERGGVVWADRYGAQTDDIYELRAQIAAAVVGALELRIPMQEAERAALKSPESLDAWGAYHLGLRHLYRFNGRDNQTALGLFQQAVKLDPSFARAHAGLSFAHFQNAFVRFSKDADTDRLLARSTAERAMELDPLDPMANYTLGRARWLIGDLDGATAWLTRCVELNPNHAQGIYVGAFIDVLSGRMDEVAGRLETARALSPYDPLRYAMLTTRGLALIFAGRSEEAMLWTERGAREPNSHGHIHMVAAVAAQTAGRPETAQAWMASFRRLSPQMTRQDFFNAFPMRDEGVRSRFSAAFDALGFL